MRRALQISDGSLTGLVNSPIAVVIYVLILALLAWPLARRLVRRTTPADREPERVG